MPFQPPRLSDRAALAAVLGCVALGFVLRVSNLDLTAFNIDEARLCIYSNQTIHALRTLDLASVPLIGIKTSWEFFNPPLFVWLMAPCFSFTPDPRFAMVFLALAGAGAAGMAGLASWRLWGGWAGVATSSLIAFCPMAIEHSRRLWGHDTIVFWAAMAIYATVRSIQTDRRRWMWLALLAAACAQACHLSGVFVWIVPLGALAVFRPPHLKVSLAAGAIAVVAVYAPWLYREATSNNFADMNQIARIVTGQASTNVEPFRVPSVVAWLTLLVDGSHNDMFGFDYAEFLFQRRWFAALYLGAHGLATCLILAGQACLIYAMRRSEESTSRRWACLLLAAGAAPVILFSILPVRPVPAYQLPAMVPIAMGVGLFLSRAGEFLAGLRRHAVERREDRSATVAILLAACILLGGFGISYTIRSRAYIAEATPAGRVSSVLRFKMDAMSWIIGSARTPHISISQDARRESTGVDFWVLYLMYWIARESSTPVDPSAPVLFVIIDSKTVLPPPAAAWLSGKAVHEFGTLSVVRLEDDEAATWRELVASLHSPASR